MFKRILSLTLVLMLLTTPLLGAIPVSAAEDYITLNIHYYRPGGDYDDWNIWAWDYDGSYIQGLDEYGYNTDYPPYRLTYDGVTAVTTLYVPSHVNYIGYYARYGNWDEKDVEYDQFINLSGIYSGVVDFYIVSGCPSQAEPGIDNTPTVTELVNNNFMIINGDGTWEPPQEEALEPNTVYAFVPESWETVYLWAWDEEGNVAEPNVSWPGSLIMDCNSAGMYFIDIPAGFNNMLLTNGYSEQTIDMTTRLTSGDDVYINATDPSNPDVNYTLDMLFMGCKHITHDINGLCKVCRRTTVDHAYDSTGYCKVCGTYVEKVVIPDEGDSSDNVLEDEFGNVIIIRPGTTDPSIEFDSETVIKPNFQYVPNDVQPESTASVSRIFLIIVVVIVLLVVVLLVLAVPVVLVVVVVIIIIAAVKKKKKKKQ